MHVSPGCPCRSSFSSGIRIQADGVGGEGGRKGQVAGGLWLSAERDEKVCMLSGFLAQGALGSREVSLMSVSHKISQTLRASATLSVPGMAPLGSPVPSFTPHPVLYKHVNVYPGLPPNSLPMPIHSLLSTCSI